ncbi:MAG TPA: cell division protein ZipA C-terminal FtsZ-binding domain-containing protein [Accumulibacter sp.]|jgi:FtsZ-interacting cell division protein ZipA|nr:cell division protein ZipA C-terminal FtsZ-binding domain-containing protein [Accumulibacter sp.]HQC80733.1 cell division protein ZipA C-terminal FtsZ-binding domain-containing protein [Accumulibacter sp.]
MTDLQMGMIGLGGIAVIGVLAYNKWQEHKHRELAEKLLSAQQADVLLDETPAAERAAFPENAEDVRVEPLLRTETAFDAPATEATTADASGPEAPGTGEPVESVAEAGRSNDRPLPEGVPPHLLSPTIDHIAILELGSGAGAYRLRETQRAALARLGKPVNWFGYNEDTCEWEAIRDDSDGIYRHVRVGLQLVDRKGPVSDGDLSVFHVAMQELASELMGLVELPMREPALQAAAQLDEFCAGVDIQIGVNVISQGQVFPGTKLRGLAESAGMVIDGEGRFARVDDDGSVLYVLVNQQTESFSQESMRTLSTNGITFLLDVPRVANGDRVLTQMVELARRFAESLRGALVDDNRRPLIDSSIEPIRRQVAQFQAAMAARHLPAGGHLAQRLFS